MRQGEIYWFRFRGEVGSEPARLRPAVVVQSDVFNATAIGTTIVAPITSNLRRAANPGNVRLGRGEANLPRTSVVNVTQLWAVDRARLGARIGVLSSTRTAEVLRGIALVLGIDPVVPAD